MATKAKTISTAAIAAATTGTTAATTSKKPVAASPAPASKPDYSLSNFRMLVLILLFIATSPVSNPVVKLVQKMLEAILAEKLFTDAIAALSSEETPLVETTESGTVLTPAGKSLATRALQTSFKPTGGGINAEQVAKTSKTNYLLAVGGRFIEVATQRVMDEVADGKFKPNDAFLYGHDNSGGMLALVEQVIDFADTVGILDEAVDNVFPDNVVVNKKRNTITPIEEEVAA